jgi:predicted ATP-dependent protease
MVRNDVHKEKELNTLIRTHLQQVHTLQNEANQKIRQLNRQVALRASEPRFAALREKYRGMPKVLDHLHAVEEDVLDKLDDFLADLHPPADNGSVGRESGRRPMSRYAVSVIVDNGQLQGAPVIEEPNPTYTNLVGHSGRGASFGALYADFTLIRAGSLLRANGGYLLLNTSDVLRDATAWDALKRTLERQEVVIEDIGEPNGFIAPTGLNPEPIPLQLRVVLVGTPTLHAQLHIDDENFRKLFKVKVDFDVQYNCGGEAPLQYGRFIARLCRDEGLLHFEGEAVAAVLEQACRWVEHQRKLSLRFGDLADLIREASYWAYQEGRTYVARPHVRRAVEARIYRSNLAAERMRELIAEGALKVDVAGAVVGQINALSLYDAGDFAFGLPARVTARVFLGEAGIVDIEREVDLSEETHSKGVLILSGYLGGLYAHEVPLSFSASLCFEQSYSEVEGDSASAAELVALLSALAELPIDQGIALTGSVNQRGELQAVSGINEKIEGFYAVCKTMGLTGNQGVVIPRQNIAHLVLNEDVVEAVSSGMFHIHAVSTVDEAIEILVGRPAGELQPDGAYPSGSVNAVALKRLQDMHERLRLEKRSRTPRKSAFPRRPPLP